jgi:prophage DNA circulation protein
LTLLEFVTPVVQFGTQLMASANRLSHAADGAIVLVPDSLKLSRYTNYPAGAALDATQTAITGITGSVKGISSQLLAAETALRLADLTNVIAVTDSGAALLAATPATVCALTQAYLSAIQTGSPFDAIVILITLASNVLNDGTPYPTMFNGLLLCELAASIIDYTPASSNEAESLIEQYVNLFDATVAPASDLGWANTVGALNALRASVLVYLQGQLAVEPSIQTQTFGDSLPDVVVSYMLYGSAAYADALVATNGTQNPLYMSSVVSYANVSAA